MHFRDMQEQGTFHAGREYERKILTKRIEGLEVGIECAIEDLKAWHCLSDDIQKRNIERFVKDFENTLKGK